MVYVFELLLMFIIVLKRKNDYFLIYLNVIIVIKVVENLDVR